ncbi:MAG: hypothetical protein N3F67_04995 [Acidilobaceae archaeon]|nr:hypothetical protein [Acidilobaceae archaeon]
MDPRNVGSKECRHSPEKAFLRQLLLALQDDLRLSIIKALAEPSVDGLSFRGLQRRLKVNHKRLERALHALTTAQLLEVSLIKVEDRTYRIYRLRNGTKELLSSLHHCD